MSEEQFTRKPRLLIADDNEAIRYMFKMLTAAECDIVGEIENGPATIDAAAELNPDVLVMDISMPGMNGFEVARILRDRTPQLRIILASQHADRIYAEEAFKLGIKGYVLKAAAVRELPVAVRDVLAGRIFRSPNIPA